MHDVDVFTTSYNTMANLARSKERTAAQLPRNDQECQFYALGETYNRSIGTDDSYTSLFGHVKLVGYPQDGDQELRACRNTVRKKLIVLEP